MEITNRDKKLLVYLAAIAIIAAAYFFGARPLLDKQMALQDEAMSLQTQVSRYINIYNNKGDYENKIAEYEVQYEELLGKFFVSLDQENTIMMIRNVEKETGVLISRLAFQESQVMVGTSSDDASGSDASTEGVPSGASLTGIKQDLSIDYSASYADFKKFLEYIKNSNQRLYISSISSSYSLESGRVTGTLILSQYALDGAEVEKTAPDLSGVTTGVGNIFTSGNAVDVIIGTIENTDIQNETLDIMNSDNPDEAGQGDDANNENAESAENAETPGQGGII